MKVNVGLSHVLPGETRNRNKEDVNWAIAWTILNVLFLSFLLIMYLVGNFDSLIEEGWDVFAICMVLFNIPTLIFSSGMSYKVKDSIHVRTLEMIIHKYDRWNWKDSKYYTYYFTEYVNLIANYTYHKHTGDYINKMTSEELNEHCKGLGEGYSDFIGYETQEKAMREILGRIKDIIADEKAAGKIEIRGVETVQTFTVEELKTMVENDK